MKKHLKSFSLVLLYLAITYILFFSLSAVFFNQELITYPPLRNFLNDNSHVVLMLWFILSFTALYFLIKKIKGQNIIEYCGFYKISLKEVLIMMLVGFGAFLFNTTFINISFIHSNFPQFDEFLTYNYEGSHIVFGFFAAVVIGPIYEEILFRGLIFKELRNSISVIPAVIVTSILYGVMFFDIPLMLFCVIAGILYCFIYVKSGNLVYIICLQFVATLGFLISRRAGIEKFISNVGDQVIIPLFVLSVFIVIYGCYLFLQQLAIKKAESNG